MSEALSKVPGTYPVRGSTCCYYAKGRCAVPSAPVSCLQGGGKGITDHVSVSVGQRRNPLSRHCQNLCPPESRFCGLMFLTLWMEHWDLLFTFHDC